MSSWSLFVLVVVCLFGVCVGSSSWTVYSGASCTGNSISSSGKATTSGSSSVNCNSAPSGLSGISSWAMVYVSNAGAAVQFYTDSSCTNPATAAIAGPPTTTCATTQVSGLTGYQSATITSNSAFSLYSLSLPLMALLAILAIILM